MFNRVTTPDGENHSVRTEVAAVAVAMEHTLRKHDALKGVNGWKSASLQTILILFGREIAELEEALMNMDNYPAQPATAMEASEFNALVTRIQRVQEEAVDVANMAMMVHDLAAMRRIEINYHRKPHGSE